MKNNMMKLNEEVGDLHFMNPTTLGWNGGERDNKKTMLAKICKHRFILFFWGMFDITYYLSMLMSLPLVTSFQRSTVASKLIGFKIA